MDRPPRAWDARPVPAELRRAAGRRRPGRCWSATPSWRRCASCWRRRAGARGSCSSRGPRASASRRCWSTRPGMAREQRLAVLHGARARAGARRSAGASRGRCSRRRSPAPGGRATTLLAGPAAPARLVFDAARARGRPAAEPGFAILHALYWLVVRLAERGPLLLVVDDAQWADEPSLRFLVYLAGRLTDQPIAVLVGGPRGRAGEGELLRQLAGEPAARVCTLPSLGAAAVAELVRGRLPEADDELCRRCFELTGGQPVAAARAARRRSSSRRRRPTPRALAAAAEVAARSLARSVLRRLEALSADAQALARGVAVFEDDAPLHLAAALTGLSAAEALAAADELARADVLRPGDPLGFTHPLVRAAVYGGLPFGERALTHRRAARLLSGGRRVGRAGERAPARGRRPRATPSSWSVLRATAQRALAQGVPRVRGALPRARAAGAAAGGGRARRCSPSWDARRRPPACPTPMAHLEAAIGLAGEPRQRAALLLASAACSSDGGRLGDACAAFRRGRDELGERRSELAVDLEAGYLTRPCRRPTARPRPIGARTRSSRPGRRLNRAERELASKAMIMRLWAGAPRERGPRDRRRPRRATRRRATRCRVAGARARRRVPERVRRLPGGGAALGACSPTRGGGARPRCSRRPPSCARASGSGPGPSPTRCSTRAPRSTCGAAGCRCTCTRPPTAWSPACSSRTTRRRRAAPWRSASTSRPPWASSPPGGTPRSGALAAHRGDDDAGAGGVPRHRAAA